MSQKKKNSLFLKINKKNSLLSNFRKKNCMLRGEKTEPPPWLSNGAPLKLSSEMSSYSELPALFLYSRSSKAFY